MSRWTAPRFLMLLFAGVFFGLLSAPAPAQTAGSGTLRAGSNWDDVLTRAETYASVRSPSDFGLSFHHERLDEIRQEAIHLRDEAGTRLAELEEVIALLGPAPEEGASPEPEETAERRKSYEDELARTRAIVVDAELTLARVTNAEAALAAAARRSLLDSVLVRLPLPLSPNTLWTSGQDVVAHAQARTQALQSWFHELPEDAGHRGLWWQFLLLFGAAATVGWLARKWILRRFGRNPAVAEPSFTRAIVAAVAEALASGVIPALIIAGLMAFFARPGAFLTGAPLQMLEVLLGTILVLVMVVAITRAVLAPGLPQWRTIEVAPSNAHRIERIIFALSLVYAIDIFFRLTADLFPSSEELISVTLTTMVLLQASGMFLLSRRRLWAPEESQPDAPSLKELPEVQESGPSESESKGRFWPYVRGVLAVGAVAGTLAALIGYGALGRFIIDRFFVTLVAIALLFLFRGILREVVGVFTRSRILRRRVGIDVETLRRIRFWVRGALDPVLILVGAVIVLPFWGVPREELSRWFFAVIEGFTVGNVTIAPLDIVIAIGVFVATMAVTRFIQRRLLERILPQTSLSVSVQHSLSASISYVGVILAAALAIAVLGVDLTNIALVAGALSVGIGFGLQNVVNNFVSGVILLAERPIKVGDWVIVGGMEGFVRRINFRGTELETFHRASVIIPNAEILSNPLTNWTHQDSRGRIDIPVGVAYGSDTGLVRDILLEIGQANEEVLEDPEPFVLFMDFGESSLDFELRCFIGEVIRRRRIASALRFEIDRRFREEGIEIPFPQRVLHTASEGSKEKQPQETVPSSTGESGLPPEGGNGSQA